MSGTLFRTLLDNLKSGFGSLTHASVIPLVFGLLGGCASNMVTDSSNAREGLSAPATSACGNVPFGAVREGARLKPAAAPKLADDSWAIVVDFSAPFKSAEGTGFTGILNVERQTIVLLERYGGTGLAQAPTAAANDKSFSSTWVGTDDEPILEVKREKLIGLADLQRLICAANNFWASKKSDFKFDGDHLVTLTVIGRDHVKDTGGIGSLDGSAAEFAELFWKIARSRPK